VPGATAQYALTGASEVRVSSNAKLRAARAGGGLEHCTLSLGPATRMNETLAIDTPGDGLLSGHVTVARVWRSYSFPSTGTYTLQLKVRRDDALRDGVCLVEDATLEIETR